MFGRGGGHSGQKVVGMCGIDVQNQALCEREIWKKQTLCEREITKNHTLCKREIFCAKLFFSVFFALNILVELFFRLFFAAFEQSSEKAYPFWESNAEKVYCLRQGIFEKAYPFVREKSPKRESFLPHFIQITHSYCT